MVDRPDKENIQNILNELRKVLADLTEEENVYVTEKVEKKIDELKEKKIIEPQTNVVAQKDTQIIEQKSITERMQITTEKPEIVTTDKEIKKQKEEIVYEIPVEEEPSTEIFKQEKVTKQTEQPIVEPQVRKIEEVKEHIIEQEPVILQRDVQKQEITPITEELPKESFSSEPIFVQQQEKIQPISQEPSIEKPTLEPIQQQEIPQIFKRPEQVSEPEIIAPKKVEKVIEPLTFTASETKPQVIEQPQQVFISEQTQKIDISEQIVEGQKKKDIYQPFFIPEIDTEEKNISAPIINFAFIYPESTTEVKENFINNMSDVIKKTSKKSFYFKCIMEERYENIFNDINWDVLIENCVKENIKVIFIISLEKIDLSQIIDRFNQLGLFVQVLLVPQLSRRITYIDLVIEMMLAKKLNLSDKTYV
jgi:hypothetical protein